MISDILSGAEHDIENYQRDFPKCYHTFREEIENVKAVMRALRIRLDTPPTLTREQNNPKTKAESDR